MAKKTLGHIAFLESKKRGHQPTAWQDIGFEYRHTWEMSANVVANEILTRIRAVVDDELFAEIWEAANG